MNHGTTGYNRLADMWSVGMVMYASLSGQLPYDEVGSRHVEKYVQDRETLFASDRWRNISSDAKDLIANKLLVISSSSRITSNVRSMKYCKIQLNFSLLERDFRRMVY